MSGFIAFNVAVVQKGRLSLLKNSELFHQVKYSIFLYLNGDYDSILFYFRTVSDNMPGCHLLSL